MSNRELPMMPWYPDQFAASTSTWSYAERNAYRTLLDVQWQLGVLPDDLKRLAGAIKLPVAELRKLWPVVGVKFPKVTGGLQNERLEEHRRRAFELKKKKQLGAQSTNEKLGRGSVRSASRSPIRSALRSADARPARRQRDATLHSSLLVKTDPKIQNSPLPLGLEAPPRRRRERATPAPQTDIHKPGNGASTPEKPQASAGLATPLPETDDLRQKVRKLSTDGQLSTGEIVKALSQYSVTPEQVEAWLAETP